MNVNYEKLDAVLGEITVTLEEKDYADKVKKQLREIAMARPEPGFRPGKTPEGILRRKYGDAVKYDVINKEVGNAVYDYIKEQDLRVLGNPVPMAEGEVDFTQPDFTFRFKVGLAPELTVKVDKDMKVPFYTIKVTDEMYDNQDKALRRRFGIQGPGEVTDPTAVIKGVLTELNEDGTVKEDGIVQENGIISLQYFASDEQKKLFEDKHPGDVVRFNPAATCNSNPVEMSSMLDIDKEDVPNHLGDFNMEIKEIIVVKPAEDGQEYYDQVFGPDKVHNAEEYKKALSDMIVGELLADSNFRFTIDAKNAIMETQKDVELPDDILKDYLKQRDENLTQEVLDADYDKNMRPQLLWQLVRDVLLKQFDVKLEEQDVKSAAVQAAAQTLVQYGMSGANPEILASFAQRLMNDEQQRERIVQNAVESKLYEAIKNAVTLDNKEVSVEEFNALFTNA